MVQPQPPSPRHGHAKHEPYHRKQTYGRRQKRSGYGLWSGRHSGFGDMHLARRDSGHLDAEKIKSSLLPSEKEVLAMSRAQYLASLRDSAAQETVIAEQQKQGEVPGVGPGAADRLSVGVCVFRLDGATLQPAVLLLRRSPAWWQARVFSSAGDGQSAGEWELPGGKVTHDDLSISAAVGRVVREQAGLRVTKIMSMLSEVRWRVELKILLWEEGSDVLGKGSSEEDEGREGEEDGHKNKVTIHMTSDRNVDSGVDMAGTTDVQSGGSGIQHGNSSNNDNNSKSKDKGIEGGNTKNTVGGGEGELSPSPPNSQSHGFKMFGIRLPTYSSSSPSPPPSLRSLTSNYWSSFMPAPAPPPKDNINININPYKDRNNQRHDQAYVHNKKPGNGYDGDDEKDHTGGYNFDLDSDSDHDPTLEPAPLSVRRRAGEKVPRRKSAESSTTLLGPALSLQPPARSARRNAAVIPYRMVRREHLQLNAAS
ncbi:hypothetical protein GGR51DRAFT_523421 [Nemania sp. FL0031]|nr:hypothetical protein GGR51DRAFT_523421 [Nemania sp. FL0031]